MNPIKKLNVGTYIVAIKDREFNNGVIIKTR